jgi:hypothetical protein
MLALRRITKPTGRTFDLQDHRMRAAVRQALKNVACASGARSRGSAGPIWAQSLYCQFDLAVRQRPIGWYEVFSVLCHLVPNILNIRRASPALGSSFHRKQAIPNRSALSGQRIFNAFIQSAYFLGVEPFLVYLEERPQERAGREYFYCVADCFPRCGKSLVRHGSSHPRLVSAGKQLRGGAIIETGHFITLQSAYRLQGST